MFICMIIARSNNARAPDDLSGRRGHAVAGDWKAALRGQNRKQAIAVVVVVIGSASMAAWLSTHHQILLLLITVLFLRTIKYVLLLKLLLAGVASTWLSVTP